MIDSRVCSELEMNDAALVLGKKKRSRLAYGHLGRMPRPRWDEQGRLVTMSPGGRKSIARE